MPPRPPKDRATLPRPALALVPSTPEPELCPYSALLRTALPPGSHVLGPDPERPGHTRIEMVSDDGRLLQPGGSFPDALLAGKGAYIDWWRDKQNGDLMAHRCPECPWPREAAPRRAIAKLA